MVPVVSFLRDLITNEIEVFGRALRLLCYHICGFRGTHAALNLLVQHSINVPIILAGYGGSGLRKNEPCDQFTDHRKSSVRGDVHTLPHYLAP